jgi:hypothetical protein
MPNRLRDGVATAAREHGFKPDTFRKRVRRMRERCALAKVQQKKI